MEAVYTIIGIVGSLASIIGAYLAIKAKNQALTAAAAAESARDFVVHKQKTTALVTILSEAKRTQNIFAKYSIAQNNRSLDGVDFKKDADQLQILITIFNEDRSLIQDNSDVNVTVTYNELNTLLADFSRSSSISNKIKIGNHVRLKIDEIIYKLKKSVDSRNTQIQIDS